MKGEQGYEDTFNDKHDESDRNPAVAHSPYLHLKGRPDGENAKADMEEVMTLCCPVAQHPADGKEQASSRKTTSTEPARSPR